MSDLVKRTEVYLQRPAYFQISGCACGNADPDWSEFMGHCWCAACRRDFTPEHAGVLDGPIPVNASRMLGIDFRMVELDTMTVFDPSEGMYDPTVAAMPLGCLLVHPEPATDPFEMEA